MQMHGPRSPREKDRDLHWRIKAKTSEELRQEFLTIYVPRIRELMAKYRDRPMDFADAALVRVAERERIETIFTVDRSDFEVYRLFGRKRFKILP